jgi:hypothetical protein
VVRTDARGLSASVQRPVALTNGMTEGVGLIGGRTVTMAGGVRMAGQEFPTTISGFPAAQSSIIPSLIGEAQPEGGVIRSRSAGSPSYQPGLLA